MLVTTRIRAGKEEVVRIMHWFTEVKGEHYQPVRMAYAIGSSAAELLSQDERPVFLVEWIECMDRARSSVGWEDSYESLDIEHRLICIDTEPTPSARWHRGGQ